MNKTIYLREEEGPIWEQARELAGDKLSPVIVNALRQYIYVQLAESRGYCRIEVEFEDADDHYIPKKKAFHGRWIFHPLDPFKEIDEESPVEAYYAVALTAKGKVVVYSWYSDERRSSGYRFVIRESLNEAAADQRISSAALAAIKKIGVPVEELDI